MLAGLGRASQARKTIVFHADFISFREYFFADLRTEMKKAGHFTAVHVKRKVMYYSNFCVNCTIILPYLAGKKNAIPHPDP